MACTYPASYATTPDLTSSSFGVSVSTRSASSSGRYRSSRSSSTSSRQSSRSSSRMSSGARDCSPNPLDAHVRKSRATCTLSLTNVYVPGSSSSSSGATTAAMLSEGAVAAAALSDTRLPRGDDRAGNGNGVGGGGGGDLHVDVLIEQIRVGGMENGVGGVGSLEEMTTEEEAVPEFAAALKLSSSSSSSPRVGSVITEIKANQIPFPTASTSIINATTATRPTTTSTSTATAAGLGAHILLRTSTLPPSSAMNTQRPSMFIRVAPLAIRTRTAAAAAAAPKPADSDNAPPARRSRKSSVSLPGVPVAQKARVSNRSTGRASPANPIPIISRRKPASVALGDHILDEDSPKVREREAERLAVTTTTTVSTTIAHARGESSSPSPPPYSPDPPSYEDAAAATAAAAAAVVRLQAEEEAEEDDREGREGREEEDREGRADRADNKPTLHQPQPIRVKSFVDLSLLKPSLVAQLSRSLSKSKSVSASVTPKSGTTPGTTNTTTTTASTTTGTTTGTTPGSTTSTLPPPPPRKPPSASDIRILLHLYRTITIGLERRHRAYEAAKAAERLEEAARIARIARRKMGGGWRFPIVEEDGDGGVDGDGGNRNGGVDVDMDEVQQGCDEADVDVECVLNEDEEERILVPAAPPPTRNSSRSSTPIMGSCGDASEKHEAEGAKRHTSKFKPEMEIQDAILSIRLRNFLKANGVVERDLEVRFNNTDADNMDVNACAEEPQEEEEEEDGGSVTYDLLQDSDSDSDEEDHENGDSEACAATPIIAPLTTTPPPPSPPPKTPAPSSSSAGQFFMPQTCMVALLHMRHRYAGQRTRRPPRVEERDEEGNKIWKKSALGRGVGGGCGGGGGERGFEGGERGFEGVVVECVDEDAEEGASVGHVGKVVGQRKIQEEEEEEEEEEEVIIVARG